jgi:hypothetical protein
MNELSLSLSLAPSSFYFSLEFTSRFLLIFRLSRPITVVTVSLFVSLQCRTPYCSNCHQHAQSLHFGHVTCNCYSCFSVTDGPLQHKDREGSLYDSEASWLVPSSFTVRPALPNRIFRSTVSSSYNTHEW